MKDKERKERFNKVATGRTNKILETLRLLGNCANQVNYSYTDEEIKKIFSAIENEVKETKIKFNTKTSREKFKL